MDLNSLNISLAPDVDGIPAWAQCQTSDCDCTTLATWSAMRPWGSQLLCETHKTKDAEKLPNNWHLWAPLTWSGPLKNPPRVIKDGPAA